MFVLRAKDKNGITLQEHLEQRKKATGLVAPELVLPPFPNVLEPLWTIFMDIHRGRSYGMNGAEPFRWTDIDAWCRLRSRKLSSGQIDLLLELDSLWVETSQKGADG